MILQSTITCLNCGNAKTDHWDPPMPVYDPYGPGVSSDDDVTPSQP
jgi:hypothetical protein